MSATRIWDHALKAIILVWLVVELLLDYSEIGYASGGLLVLYFAVIVLQLFRAGRLAAGLAIVLGVAGLLTQTGSDDARAIVATLVHLGMIVCACEVLDAWAAPVAEGQPAPRNALKQLRIVTAVAMVIDGPGSIEELVRRDLVIAAIAAAPYLAILWITHTPEARRYTLPIVVGGLSLLFVLPTVPGLDTRHRFVWTILMAATNLAMVWTAFRANPRWHPAVAEEEWYQDANGMSRAKLCAIAALTYWVILGIASAYGAFGRSWRVSPFWFLLLVMILLPHIAVLSLIGSRKLKSAGAFGISVGLFGAFLLGAAIGASFSVHSGTVMPEPLLWLGAIALFFELGLVLGSGQMFAGLPRRPQHTAKLIFTLCGGLVYFFAFFGVAGVTNGVPTQVIRYSSRAVAELRTINTAQVTYLSSSGGNYGTIEDLVKAGLLDSRYQEVLYGFRYEVVASTVDYTAYARPVDEEMYSYYSTADAVIRYLTGPPGVPPGGVVQ